MSYIGFIICMFDVKLKHVSSSDTYTDTRHWPAIIVRTLLCNHLASRVSVVPCYNYGLLRGHHRSHQQGCKAKCYKNRMHVTFFPRPKLNVLNSDRQNATKNVIYHFLLVPEIQYHLFYIYLGQFYDIMTEMMDVSVLIFCLSPNSSKKIYQK